MHPGANDQRWEGNGPRHGPGSRPPALSYLAATLLALAPPGLVGAAEPARAEPPPSAPPAAEAAPANAPDVAEIAELHAVAQSLWDAFVPESIKQEYELIPPQELAALLRRVARAGEQEDLTKFAELAPETRAAIAAIRASPDFADYADWLREQLADMEVAQEATTLPPPPPKPPPKPARPAPPAAREAVPLYELWVTRVEQRPRPARADEFLPVLRSAFAAEGLPEALVWLAETESSFNPRARSPAGARGLFQLMPETAKALGLSLLPLDQRTHPEASARAAAAYLKKLHERFGDWPLALAAYNGGEGRVSRTLKARGANDFAGIAAHLPAETRLYVPKVLATVRVRAGAAPEDLPAPRTATP
jgi:membrane-bound lytic murein transglycosylase D